MINRQGRRFIAVLGSGLVQVDMVSVATTKAVFACKLLPFPSPHMKPERRLKPTCRGFFSAEVQDNAFLGGVATYYLWINLCVNCV